MQKIIVIYGPTAVGKSAVAVCLAKKINAEIISADSMQIYKDLINMGADITVIDNKAFINGIDKLNEYTSCAFDLRHGASLLLLALKNGGVINNLEVVERGYDSLYKKLKSLGARVTFL